MWEIYTSRAAHCFTYFVCSTTLFYFVEAANWSPEAPALAVYPAVQSISLPWTVGQRCCAGQHTLSEAWEEVIPQCVFAGRWAKTGHAGLLCQWWCTFSPLTRGVKDQFAPAVVTPRASELKQPTNMLWSVILSIMLNVVYNVCGLDLGSPPLIKTSIIFF